MAKRETNIYIESFGTSNNTFAIYSDLAPWRIKKVEGVHNVSTTLIKEGYLIVTIDKRWNIKKVIKEIKELA